MIMLTPAIIFTGLTCFLIGLILGYVLTNWPALALWLVAGLAVAIGIAYVIYLDSGLSR